MLVSIALTWAQGAKLEIADGARSDFILGLERADYLLNFREEEKITQVDTVIVTNFYLKRVTLELSKVFFTH